MAERDSFWQFYLLYYNGKDDNGNAYPINRLIDWAWQFDISNKVETETARLTAQTLVWVLASTNHKLRDQTTKALVNLLENQIDILLILLDKFKDVGDLYISERLYAIAYGCSLRTSKPEDLRVVSQYVFDNIFRKGQPPNHILLRDYARNIIEFAIYKNVFIEGNISLIRPPYKSKLKIPTEKQIERYLFDETLDSFKSNYGDQNNKIHFSVMDWDFGRYVVEGAFYNFSVINIHQEAAFDNFIKNLSKTKKSWVNLFIQYYDLLYLSNKSKNLLSEKLAVLKEGFSNIKQTLNKILNQQEKEFLNSKIISYAKMLGKDRDPFQHFDDNPIRRWIVKRVFDLGYKAKWHGRYDSQRSDFNNRSSENKIDRIGKKYQWIAFYEILGIISDNYKIKDRWNSTNKPMLYQGPWQLNIRNIDPIFISKRKLPKKANEFENWSFDNVYAYWQQANQTWIDSIKDLPDPKQLILRTDEEKEEWVYLGIDASWEEPKPIGQEKYEVQRKEFWYSIQSYIIEKTSTVQFIAWLKKQKNYGDLMPTGTNSKGVFNREHFWAPASKQHPNAEWEKVKNTKYKVLVSTCKALGEISDDRSGANSSYDMPCQMLFDGMDLKYAQEDGKFQNINGEIVVTNINPKGILIKKKKLVNFLEANNLEIIWALRGEKMVFGPSRSNSGNLLKYINGVYHLDGNIVNGELTTFLRR